MITLQMVKVGGAVMKLGAVQPFTAHCSFDSARNQMHFIPPDSKPKRRGRERVALSSSASYSRSRSTDPLNNVNQFLCAKSLGDSQRGQRGSSVSRTSGQFSSRNVSASSTLPKVRAKAVRKALVQQMGKDQQQRSLLGV